jgi:thiamine-phosphate pyrophosphorylase
MVSMTASPRAGLRLLSARARALKRAAASGAPALFFFTDPQRTPDPIAIARRLPRGAAIVYRHFDAADRLAKARALRRIAARRGLALLIGADGPLAARVRADGVHLPERAGAHAPLLRRRHPGWLITIAAHDARAAARAGRAGAAAIMLSPVFPSRSPSAAGAHGPRTSAAIAARTPCPVIALGGVNARTIKRLRGAFAGIAGIEAFCDG